MQWSRRTRAIYFQTINRAMGHVTLIYRMSFGYVIAVAKSYFHADGWAYPGSASI